MGDENNGSSFDPIERVLWLISAITLIGLILINII